MDGAGTLAAQDCAAAGRRGQVCGPGCKRAAGCRGIRRGYSAARRNKSRAAGEPRRTAGARRVSRNREKRPQADFLHVVMNDELVKRHCTNSTSKTYFGDQWVTLELELARDGVFCRGDPGVPYRVLREHRAWASSELIVVELSIANEPETR